MQKVIGVVDSPYKEKFCIPRRAGLNPCVKGMIKILPPFNTKEAFLGLDEFNYIWISFGFHKAVSKNIKLSIRPPRLGGNKKIGVFASRSPFRPNSMGLSAVKLEKIEYKKSEVLLHISGHDFLDETPVYDIRPYLPESDFIKEANSGWTKGSDFKNLDMNISYSKDVEDFFQKDINSDLEKQVKEILINDPRPAYKQSTSDSYAFRFSDFDIHFEIDENDHVSIKKIQRV